MLRAAGASLSICGLLSTFDMDSTATKAALSDLRDVVSKLDDAATHLDSPPEGAHTLLPEVIELLDQARGVEQDFERLRQDEISA